MIALYKGEDSIQRSQALKAAVDNWLGPKAKDPYSRETIHVEDSSQEESPLDRFFQAAAGNSMFAEQKAIILQGLDKLKADQFEEIIQQLEQAAPETGFFFEAEKLNANLRIAKTIKKLGEIHTFDSPKPWEMAKWLMGRASHHGFRVSPINADYFIELVGSDQHKIENEFNKLRNYDPQAKEITHEMLNEVVVSTNQGNQFEFVKYFATRNIPKALKSLHQIFKSGKNDFEHCIPLNSLLFNHFQALMVTQEQGLEGVPPDTIAKELGKHPFMFKKEDYVGQSKMHSMAKLNNTLIQLAEIDAKLKNGGIRTALQFEIEILQLV